MTRTPINPQVDPQNRSTGFERALEALRRVYPKARPEGKEALRLWPVSCSLVMRAAIAYGGRP